MTAIFLFIITLGVTVFFCVNRSVSKFLPNNRLKHATTAGYIFQLIGLVGLVIYHVEFLSTPALQISLESNFPDLLRAFSELLWPIAAIIGTFWCLPKVLDFFNDTKKFVPLFEAIYGKHSTQDNLNFPKSVDIDKIPVNEGYSEAHKELINQYKSLLTRDTDEEKISKLLHHAADLQLRADFESLYNIIFGSQIQALQVLSANKNINLTPFYQKHCERTEKAEAASLASFDLWIQLLKHYGLVMEDSNKYSLSNKGILFLKFLKERNYYLDKAF